MMVATYNEKLSVIDGMKRTYREDGRDLVVDETNSDSISISVGDDGACIATYELEPEKYTLFLFHADECQHKVLGVFDDCSDAQDELLMHIDGETEFKFNFDEGDIDDYAASNEFGSHDEERGFFFFKIVTTK
jgi:hypothetical protein